MESVLAARFRRPRPALRKGLRLRARLQPRTLLIAALTSVALIGGFLLFRSSSFVSISQIEITGVRGPDAAAISQALQSTAHGMSTMDYSVGGLQAAVAQYPVVRSLQVSTSFPHRMRISVLEQLPVAQLTAAGVHSAVAADGVVLGSALAARTLPSLPVSEVPAVGRHVGGGHLLAYLQVLGAAPAPLLPLVSRLYTGSQGLTVRMRNGLLIYFGDASRPHAKWDSLVTVLTAQGSAGASYVDVRLPERPAAGVPSGGVGSSESGQVSASDPTSAALAASLARAVNGESSTPTKPTEAEASATAQAGATQPSGAAESEEPPAATTGQATEGVSTEGSGTNTAEGG